MNRQREMYYMWYFERENEIHENYYGNNDPMQNKQQNVCAYFSNANVKTTYIQTVARIHAVKKRKKTHYVRACTFIKIANVCGFYFLIKNVLCSFCTLVLFTLFKFTRLLYVFWSLKEIYLTIHREWTTIPILRNFTLFSGDSLFKLCRSSNMQIKSILRTAVCVLIQLHNYVKYFMNFISFSHHQWNSLLR